MVSSAVTLFTLLFSVLVPQKMWYAPSQPLTVTNKSDRDVTLELTDFSGKAIAAKGSADAAASQSVDLKNVFPDTSNPGTFVLYALAKGSSSSQAGPPKDFLGTPLVIEVLPQMQQPQAAGVTHVLPLQYAVMTTDAGALTEAFYYDSAPHTVDNFLTLASGGYFDGSLFHRVVPGFVIQGGSPLGDDPDPNKRSAGGPGFTINDEFSDRPHLEGVLSMANTGQPNSAGSQFFICLDYAHTKQLDQKYTVFGRVVQGMDAVNSIGSAKVNGELPEHPAAITKVEVFPVTAQKNPYASIMSNQGK
jgi:cyclophilin family peptidyl-prolyl cis-trans isomerase